MFSIQKSKNKTRTLISSSVFSFWALRSRAQLNLKQFWWEWFKNILMIHHWTWHNFGKNVLKCIREIFMAEWVLKMTSKQAKSILSCQVMDKVLSVCWTLPSQHRRDVEIPAGRSRRLHGLLLLLKTLIVKYSNNCECWAGGGQQSWQGEDEDI